MEQSRTLNSKRRSKRSPNSKNRSYLELATASDAPNDLDCHSKKSKLGIHGLQLERDECLTKGGNMVASKLRQNCLMTSNRIASNQTTSALHKLPNKKDKPSAVIVGFLHVCIREQGSVSAACEREVAKNSWTRGLPDKGMNFEVGTSVRTPHKAWIQTWTVLDLQLIYWKRTPLAT